LTPDDFAEFERLVLARASRSGKRVAIAVGFGVAIKLTSLEQA